MYLVHRQLRNLSLERQSLGRGRLTPVERGDRVPLSGVPVRTLPEHPVDMRGGFSRRRGGARSALLVREDGIALVLALGVMLALTVSLATVILFSAAGARDTIRTNSGQRAYALAEAGINNAMSVLRPFYADGTVAGT